MEKKKEVFDYEALKKKTLEQFRSGKSLFGKRGAFAANVDGFRCDFADGPPFDFWKQAIDTLRNISTHKLLLMAEGARSANFEAGFDYNFGFRFFEDLKKIYEHHHSVLSIDNLNVTDYKDASDGQRIIRYITNHDVNGSDGTPLELFGGEKGSMAAFVNNFQIIGCQVIKGYAPYKLGKNSGLYYVFNSFFCILIHHIGGCGREIKWF